MSKISKVVVFLLAGMLIVSFAAAKEPCGHAGKDAPKATAAQKSFDSPPAVGTKAICPVMGSEFTVKKDTTRSEHKGRHYAFCCPGCKPKFDADPAKYTGKK